MLSCWFISDSILLNRNGIRSCDTQILRALSELITEHCEALCSLPLLSPEAANDRNFYNNELEDALSRVLTVFHPVVAEPAPPALTSIFFWHKLFVLSICNNFISNSTRESFGLSKWSLRTVYPIAAVLSNWIS